MRRDGILTLLILAGLIGGVIVGQILHLNSAAPEDTGAAWMSIGKLVLVKPLMLLVLQK